MRLIIRLVSLFLQSQHCILF